MPFAFSERHVAEYYRDGYTVFCGILPPALVADLRRSTDRAREIAREKRGQQAQRLQPIGDYADQIDLQPFRDYEELPVLVDAFQRVLSTEHRLAGLSRLGVLLEPAEMSWCTVWHRDIKATSPGVDPDEYAVVNRDPTFFTQVNCALYTDASTWYVPGSDGRPDLPGELAVAEAKPDDEGLTCEERERVNLEYCNAMPGAVQLVLEAGDFALYRPNAWHIGNYAPYRKRATLHDGVWKPETRAWYERWSERRRAQSSETD